MEQTIAAPLSTWESFYVVVGSASATLTGLQFVVIVLNAQLSRSVSGSATRAFATPTIVHFCAVLFIAAVLSAPWPALTGVSLALGICAAAGLVYAVLVVYQARHQTDYALVLEDWIWHCALPIITYMALLMCAVFLARYPVPSLFVVAGIVLLLLFIGIHNAWDAVVYIALQRRQ